jgi:lysophospholipase L1-like esterase
MAWGMRNIVISLFGSSIMEGRIGVESAADRYYSILQRKLSERFPEVCFSIINGSVGGWSTRELMQKVFDEKVQHYSPDYCCVMFGANNNDLANPERILQPGELEKLMKEFQERLPKTCKRIGVVLNPIINERHWVSTHPLWQEAICIYGGLNEMEEEEREKARNFYRENDFPIVDLA